MTARQKPRRKRVDPAEGMVRFVVSEGFEDGLGLFVGPGFAEADREGFVCLDDLTRAGRMNSIRAAIRYAVERDRSRREVKRGKGSK